jgi:hypothetical protein
MTSKGLSPTIPSTSAAGGTGRCYPFGDPSPQPKPAAGFPPGPNFVGLARHLCLFAASRIGDSLFLTTRPGLRPKFLSLLHQQIQKAVDPLVCL